MRAIVISDAHGQPHLITNALEHADYNQKKDRLIFAGDFVDIGSFPQKCLDVLQENRAEMLWGNHELAIILNKHISPQSIESRSLLGPISQIPFKVVAIHDDVVITHAGVSIRYKTYADDFKKLNDVTLNDLWHDDSPVWFRPGKVPVCTGIKQVIGHTPFEYIQKYFPETPLENVYMIDPYTTKGMGKDRFRYATIKNGDVTVWDSIP
jgi:hypothetical protein